MFENKKEGHKSDLLTWLFKDKNLLNALFRIIVMVRKSRFLNDTEKEQVQRRNFVDPFLQSVFRQRQPLFLPLVKCYLNIEIQAESIAIHAVS
jgi:hypothetical protein